MEMLQCSLETWCVFCIIHVSPVSLVFLACGKAARQQDISWTWDMFEKSLFPRPTVSSLFNLWFVGASHWTLQWITNQLSQSFANSEAHATPLQIFYLINLCLLFETCKTQCNALKRAHVISLVFMFWQTIKSELVDRRQRHLIHFRHQGHCNAFLKIYICFPYKTSCQLSLIIFNYQLNTINGSVLILSFSSVFAFYFHQVSTHSSLKHNTFYI